MLESSPPMCFLATADAARSRTFYESTLGLRCVADEPFALVFDLHGTTLRIQKVPQVTALPYTALGWLVDDVRSMVAHLLGRGVDFERYPFLKQDSQGIWTAPGGALVAWFKDPDGNLLSLTQR